MSRRPEPLSVVGAGGSGRSGRSKENELLATRAPEPGARVALAQLHAPATAERFGKTMKLMVRQVPSPLKNPALKRLMQRILDQKVKTVT